MLRETCFDYFRMRRAVSDDRTVRVVRLSASLECNKWRNDGESVCRLRRTVDLPDESAFSNSAWLLTACAQTIFVRLFLTSGKKFLGSGETVTLHMAASETHEEKSPSAIIVTCTYTSAFVRSLQYSRAIHVHMDLTFPVQCSRNLSTSRPNIRLERGLHNWARDREFLARRCGGVAAAWYELPLYSRWTENLLIPVCAFRSIITCICHARNELELAETSRAGHCHPVNVSRIRSSRPANRATAGQSGGHLVEMRYVVRRLVVATAPFFPSLFPSFFLILHWFARWHINIDINELRTLYGVRNNDARGRASSDELIMGLRCLAPWKIPRATSRFPFFSELAHFRYAADHVVSKFRASDDSPSRLRGRSTFPSFCPFVTLWIFLWIANYRLVGRDRVQRKVCFDLSNEIL